MYKRDWVRTIAVQLFYKPADALGLRPNTVTIGNFILNGIPAVLCFAIGHTLWALYFCVIYNLLDYIDGELARRKFGGSTQFGTWLDTSLDWLLYLLIIGGMSYGTKTYFIGYICLISTVYGNYVSVTTRQNKALCGFPFSPVVWIALGAVTGQIYYTLLVMTVVSIVRVMLLWKSSIKALSLD